MVEHVIVGAVDGPSEAVVEQVHVFILSLSPPKKEGHFEHAHPKMTNSELSNTAVVLVHCAKGGSTRTHRRLGPPVMSMVILLPSP